MIIGVDEVGYGPLAGPLVVVAVMGVESLPFSLTQRLDDSKKLSPQTRAALAEDLRHLPHVVIEGSVKDIDEKNILATTHTAMMRAVLSLTKNYPQHDFDILIDGNRLPHIPTAHNIRGVVGGDGKYSSIAVASILAKVHRDRMMIDFAHDYPHYGFAQHKGYGTAQHIKMLRQYGACPLHRRSFIKNIIPAK